MKKDTPLDIMRASAEAMAERLKMLAHPERLLMLCRMADREATVGELVDITGMSQSAVSQHLARFRECGLVKVRPEGQARFYSLTDEGTRSIISALCDICERDRDTGEISCKLD